MGLLDKRLIVLPFEYPIAFDYWTKQQQSHWLPSEVQLGSDVLDWTTRLTESEKEVVGRTLKGFTQIEVIVQDYWSTKVRRWFKKPEIQMTAAAFANMEGIHQQAYSYLQETLGMTDFAAFLHEPAAKAKIDRVMQTVGKSKEEIALSLAVFSAFTEGVNLFSSFAILMSFSRRNTLKGIGQIVAWSVRDESLHCLPVHTRVRIKGKGFIPLSQVSIGDTAYGYKDGRIVESPILDTILGKHTGGVYKFNSTHIKQTVTDEHFMSLRDGSRLKVSDFIRSKTLGDLVIKAEPLVSESPEIFSDDFLRLLMAVQADGCYSKSRPNELRFHLYKERKIRRLEQILAGCGMLNVSWHINEAKGQKRKLEKKYSLKSEDFCLETRRQIRQLMPDKLLPMFLLDLNTRQKQVVVEELRHWDGSTLDDGRNFQYATSIKHNAEIALHLLNDVGLFPRMLVRRPRVDQQNNSYVVTWGSKESLNTCNRHEEGKGNGVSKKNYESYDVIDMPVGCLTTGTGNFIILTDEGTVELTGNSKFGTWLFRTLVEEYPEIFTDDLKEQIYEAARETVKLEDNFIDQSFDMGPIPSIDADDLKAYIRFRTNTMLGDLNLKSLYKPNKEKIGRLDWFSVLVGGVEFQDFFAGRVTSYAKSVADFSEVFS